MEVDGGSLQVTISIGVSGWRNDQSISEIIKYADRALYDAKRSGRNQVCQYNSTQSLD